MFKNLEKIKISTTIMMFIGLVVIVISLSIGLQERVWHAYLLSYFYFLLFSLGGLFFLSIHYATGAGWSVSIKRLAEALTAYFPVACILTIPLIYGSFSLYDWLDADKVAHDSLLAHKSPYLNLPFFIIRLIIFLGTWMFLAKKLVSFSLKQDVDGNTIWTKKCVKYSIIFLLFFAFSLSLFSIDLIMSLDPHWFSTIYGLYIFAGIFQSIFAILILLSYWLLQQQEGKYKKWINENHLHDLGKFLLAATMFWAYIAFSQYMLIWYANLPEETTFFVPRSKGMWAVVSISLILFKFFLPFFILLPRWVKRKWKIMISISILILVMHFIDIYWLIYPHYDSQMPQFSYIEIGIFLGFLGIFIRSVFTFLYKHSPIPLKDPYETETLNHHVTY